MKADETGVITRSTETIISREGDSGLDVVGIRARQNLGKQARKPQIPAPL